MLRIRKITIQWITIDKTNFAVHQIVIYPLDIIYLSILWTAGARCITLVLVLIISLNTKTIRKLDFGLENSCIPVLSAYLACSEERMFLKWNVYFMSVSFGFNFCPRVKKYQTIVLYNLLVKTSLKVFQLIKIKAKLHLHRYRRIVIGFRQQQVQAVRSLNDKYHFI